MPKPHKKKRRNQTIYVDIDSTKMVKGFKLGQEVTVTMKGKIKGMEAPHKSEFGDEPETYPGNIRIGATSIKVEGENVFSDLSKEEDGD